MTLDFASCDYEVPVCPSCGELASVYTADFIYGGRVPQRAMGEVVWACLKCDTRVGCHRGTSVPLGTMAGPGLRAARREAHAAFDRLWNRETPYFKSRKKAYKDLSKYMRKKEAHIGEMDIDECIRVIRFSREFLRDRK